MLILKTLEDKYTLLQTLDELILAICPMEDIETKIGEAENLTDKITRLRLQISTVVPKVEVSESKQRKV